MQNSDKNKLHGTGVGSVLHAPAVLLVEARMIRNNVESGAGSRSREVRLSREHDQVMEKILELYADLFLHDGFGSISIEMKFLKKGQKEIIISSGKDYRFVVDWPEPAEKE
ncbi:hypothetical protein [Desulfonatronovibrio hydrogenovorans]|uniref:hypothetical protein n=1 Tax=Desulfonatronovibrio hydrogenovorans TaxID=53245 RepID=UPI00123788E4|nr:hypothetical protein [Desulfonatronovibrio hydrogenovorans]